MTTTAMERRKAILRAKTKPTTLTVDPGRIPAEIRAKRRWVLWAWTWKTKKKVGRWDKPPLRSGGGYAKVNDPATWVDFADALAALRANPARFSGLGYVLDEGEVGVDLDAAVEGGKLLPWAAPIAAELSTYTDASPSGTGAKLLCKGGKPGWLDNKCKARFGEGEVEVYDHTSPKYFTVTGRPVAGCDVETVEHRPEQVEAVCRQLWPHQERAFAAMKDDPAAAAPAPSPVGRNGSAPAHNRTCLTDEEVINKAAAAKNCGKFARLFYNGDTSGHGDDDSRADSALVWLLTFYTRDRAQLDRLFRQSRLYRPEKWDGKRFTNGESYGERTVRRAIEKRGGPSFGDDSGPVCHIFRPGKDGEPAPGPTPPDGTGDPPADPAGADQVPGEPETEPQPEADPDGTPDGAEDPGDVEGLPVILASNRQLPEVTEDALRAVCAANDPPRLFQRGGLLVRVRVDPERAVARVEDLDANALRGHLARTARWFEAGDKKGVVAAPPAREVVSDFAALPDFPGIPPLLGLVECPVFDAAGNLINTTGYHPGGMLVYRPAPGLDVPPVPESPGPDDVAAARDLLLVDLLGDFPFVDEAGKAHALAALLLPFVRQMVDGPTPLHLFDAAVEGTGKSLLAECVACPAVGRQLSPMAECGTDDEWRKRITAALVAAPTFLMFDNLSRTLDSGALAAALTAHTWTDRLLGFTKVACLPVTCVWLATGNNATLSREMRRRTVWTRLDAKSEHPWQRPPSRFRHPNLPAWAAANRGRLVAAALTLCRAWVAAGKPSGNKSLGRFESWAEVMGGILDVADVPGLLDNVEAFMHAAADPGEEWRAFVQVWWSYHGEDPVGVDKLYNLAVRQRLLDAVLGDGGERSQRTRLGGALGRVAGRVYGNLRVDLLPDTRDHSGRRRYRLTSTQPHPDADRGDGDTGEGAADAPA